MAYSYLHDFTNNEKVKLNINGLDGFSQSITLNAISDGSFTYSFLSNTSINVINDDNSFPSDMNNLL